MSKKRKMGFRGRMKETIEKRKKGSAYGYLLIPKGTQVFSPEKEGSVEMDIMPYLVSDERHPDKNIGAEVGSYWYRRPFKVHRDIGSGRDSVVCLASLGLRCPICEYRNKLRKEEGDEDTIKQLRPSNRNLYAVIIKKIGKKSSEEEGIQLFDMSDYLFQEVMETQLVEQDEDLWEIFPDPEEGSSIKVVFSEDAIGKNKYLKATRFDFVKREEQYDESILDEVPDLDTCLNILSYDELKAKFFEMEEAEQEEEEQEEEPETEEEEEEEEEKPKRGRVRRSAKPEPKEDDECPFDHKFGKDFDEFDDCDDCKIWQECRKKKRGL